jgi:hypothetical protein
MKVAAWHCWVIELRIGSEVMVQVFEDLYEFGRHMDYLMRAGLRQEEHFWAWEV